MAENKDRTTCEHVENCLEKGHCAVHGVEIERRKQTVREVAELKAAIGIIQERLSPDGRIGEALQIAANFRSKAYIAAFIMFSIYLGSYWFTNMHVNNLSHTIERRDSLLTNQLEQRKNDRNQKISDLEKDVDFEFNKFHRQLNQEHERINALNLEVKLTAERFDRIIDDMAEVKVMLAELMKKEKIDNPNKVQY